MENQTSQSFALPKYLMPLLVTSVLLSLTAGVLSVFSLVKPIVQTDDQLSSDVVALEDGDVECSDTISCNGDFVCDEGQCVGLTECTSDDECSSGDCYKGSCIEVVVEQTGTLYQSAGGDFVFSIPHGAVVRQTDSGGRSAISIYKSEELLWQSEGLIYSILFVASSEFETGESYSFAEWLEREGVTLTGHSSQIGGLQFEEGHSGDIESLSFFHYVAETDNERAYVLVVPAVRSTDELGKFVEDSLDFDPTDEEINLAELIP